MCLRGTGLGQAQDNLSKLCTSAGISAKKLMLLHTQTRCYMPPAAIVLTERQAFIGFEPPQTSIMEVRQINLESNQTMRRNPFPDQAEMRFLMGKSPHVCSKERGRGKWVQITACPEEAASICLSCSSRLIPCK